MSVFADRIAGLSPKRLAILAYELQCELEAYQQAKTEPIAIVGMGCRLPGRADSPIAFWRLLREGFDAVSEVPADRWDIDASYDPDPDAPGKMNSRFGAFLDRVDLFDADFFGIAPREARRMEPQQRLLLEVAWEAIENSGYSPDGLAGSRTGVFVGVCANDYSRFQFASPQHLDAYCGSGVAHSILANRLSYVLDLRGPSMALDTACSSSLVAVHLAVQSLRQRECEIALAGGVNLLLSAEASIILSKARMLAPDGRCKTFSADADGYVRGEGCGVVVLKRLADALAAGDSIYALIRGSAVNQDGRTNGLTAPNLLAQREVLVQALQNGGVAAEQVGMIEAHGTGTPLGDPIEVDALRAVYGPARAAGGTCALGSVKTNIGHLEGAAGIAGLLKSVLALRHGMIPAHLHCRQLNPNISLDGTPFFIPDSLQNWPAGLGRRLAAVSSFGFGGTNAHVVLEEPPARSVASETSSPLFQLLTLSARSEAARDALRLRFRDHLSADNGQEFADICFTSHAGRTHFAHRMAIVAASREEAVEQLTAAAGSAPRVWSGRADTEATPAIAFLFTGQGAQYAGMGRQLFESHPVFRAALERCNELLRSHLDVALLDLLHGPIGETTLLDRTQYAQPAIFALEWALAELWESWGVSPGALLGHSVGEVVAACRAGVFSLEDGLRLIAARGALMERATRDGAMAAVFAPEDKIAAIVARYAPRGLAIGARNGPSETVISGRAAVVEEALRELAAAGIKCRRLPGEYAFHSPQLDTMLDSFESATLTVQFTPPGGRLVSNLTGRFAAGREMGSADYWRRQAREPVEFAAGLETLAAAGFRIFLEIGPQPTLIGLGARMPWAETALWLPSLRKDRDDWPVLLESLGRLYVAGATVDWSGFHRMESRRRVWLPTYPFERVRYWVDDLESGGAPALFESTVSISSPPYFQDHRVYGSVVVPGAHYVTMALATAERSLGAGPHRLDDVLYHRPLTLPEGETKILQLALTEAGTSGKASFQVFGKNPDASGRDMYASGVISTVQDPGSVGDQQEIRARCKQELAGATFYDEAAKRGLEFGPAFRWIERLWLGEAEALCELRQSEYPSANPHPGLIDACQQCLAALLPPQEELYLPIGVQRVEWYGAPSQPGWIHGRLARSVGDVDLYDAEGRLLLAMQGVAFARAPRSKTAVGSWLHTIEWRAQALPPLPAEPPELGQWLLFSDSSGLALRLAELLRKLGQEPLLAEAGAGLPRLLEEAGERCRGIVYLSGLDAPPQPEPFPEALALSLRAPLELAQSLVAQKSRLPVWWVTQGAQPVGPGAPVTAPAQAPLWGLAATLAEEHPEICWTAIDLDPGLPASSAAAALAANLFATELTEPRRAVRGGVLYVPRLTRSIETEIVEQPVRLQVKRSRGVDEVQLASMERRTPQAGEVELRVEATGLNFRDVLTGLGMYPGESGPLGGECAGRVVAVGTGVTDLAVGDRVVALARESFATYVTVNSALVARLPAGLSAVEAATLPLVFLTVRYALEEVAGLRPGERLLVHSAAGGIGLAAVQWARLVGAQVFGTVGSAHKRELMEALGVTVVGNSRQIPSAEDMRRAMEGSGVQVVLNALSGEAIERSLELLSPGGRFVELGKRGIWNAEQVAQQRPDVAYHIVDLADKILQAPETVGAWLREIVALVHSGKLRPLPLQTVKLRQAGQAFRTMAQGQHVGKLVVVGEAPAPRELPIRAEGSYLITGGLGGVGLALGAWLVEQGARHLVLASRRPPDAAQQAQIAQLEQAGASVTALELDVSDRNAVSGALAGLQLRAVIHTAGIIDDALLGAQNWDRVCRVLAPKVAGLWELERHTAGQELDFFIVCSSAVALLGSAGQAGYAAANAFLDGWAHWRRARGAPALSINWGPIADAGLAAQVTNAVQAQWTAAGVRQIPAAVLGAALVAASRTGEPQVAALPIDWKRMPAGAPPFLKELVTETAPPPVSRQRASLSVHKLVRSSVAEVLGLTSGSAIDAGRPLGELGLDSLMAVELRNQLARRLERPLPATLAFDYPTISALVTYLAEGATPRVAGRSEPLALEEGIAIIGIGCRLPGGVTSPEELWRLLADGVDAIGEVPRERWDIDSAPYSETGTRWGGFLQDVDRFDAAFFGIAPREAVSMDPQQRMLLEVSCEALERAGVPAAGLAGSLTGVFVGISTNDYSQLQGGVDAYTGTGSALSVAAGRLSYVLGLQGPSMALDTACSSSLVAVHLACQSLRLGECDLALAGGVNVILNPGGGVYFSKLGVMAADGRCKTFDARADGYVRSEGCGVIVLKRLSEARRDGDLIVAVVRGSAVNQDGRSSGLTAPNGPAQEAVIRSAVARAGVRPMDVSYVEAHGTGTALGDPIELQALSAALGEGRTPERPVIVGSLKTNMGHLEAAAGIAGLIKVVLTLEHGQIPPHLHFQEPSPQIAWDRLPVRVPTALMPWPGGYETRVAGVSSFGFSGTNAHIVLEQARHETTAVAHAADPYLLPLSARTPAALRALVDAWRNLLERDRPAVRDLCYTASLRRSHHEERLAVVGSTFDELRAGLDLCQVSGLPKPQRPKVAFVFPGQGGQHAGMARQLLAREPVFHNAIEACDRAFRAHVDWSLLELLERGEGWEKDIARVQPALFAVQVGLVALWQSWGIQPDAVVGHSMGEVGAAYVAGILTLEHAAQIICRRSALLCQIRGRGAMLLAELSLAEAERMIQGAKGLAVAASNGPRTSVLAGDVAAVERLEEELEGKGVFCRRVQVDVASHSEQVEELAPALRQALAGVSGQAGTIPMYSTVTGAVCAGEGFDAGYWMANLRQRVRFWEALEKMAGDGHLVYVEMSPHPVLGPAMEEGLRALRLEGTVRSSLRRGEEDRRVLLETLGSLYEQGQPVLWQALYADGGRHVALPTYPWQRERFWMTPSRRGVPLKRLRHPLLGERLDISREAGVSIWQSDVGLETCALYADHRVQDTVVLPAAAYVEMALAATDGGSLEQISFEQLLTLPSEGTRRLEFVLGPQFRISSQDSESRWTLHAAGVVTTAPAEPPPSLEIAGLKTRCTEVIEGDDFYQALSANGLNYGPAFRCVSKIWRRDGEALACLQLPAAVVSDTSQYLVHPALLDSCFQTLGAALPVHDDNRPPVPAGIARVDYLEKPAGDLWVHARLVSTAGDTVNGDVMLMDSGGRAFIAVKDLEARRLRQHDDLDDWLYTLRWKPALDRSTSEPPQRGGSWLIFADSGGVGDTLKAYLEARGAHAIAVRPGEINLENTSGLRKLLRDVPLPCRGIVFLWPLDNATDSTASVLHLVQALAQTGWRDAPRLCLVTRGAMGLNPGQAPLWGFARTLALEHPELRCTRLDLSPTSGPEELAVLCESCWLETAEQEIAWRDGGKYVARLVRTRLESGRPLRIREEGAYLLTGAFGGIGLAVARWLVARGARCLVLTGIREPSAAARHVIEELRATGATVITACADVAQREELECVLLRMDADSLTLRGVFHCAGVLDDGILVKLTRERLERVMAPKVAGAWNLHALTEGRALDHFVLFSSASAMLGSPGQANYTAANSFLDALAHYRRSLGLPALSINWGPWSEVGLAAAQANRGQRLAVQGIGSLTPEQGIRALERLMGQAEPQVAVLPFDLRQWREFHPAIAEASLFEELLQEVGYGDAPKASGPRMSDRLRQAEEGQRRGLLEEHLRDQIAHVLRLDSARIGPQTTFGSMGLDSLMGLEIRNRLERSLGLTLPATLVWTYPTLSALTTYFEAALDLTVEGSQGRRGAASAGDDRLTETIGEIEDEVEEMSEDEAQLVLKQELAALDRADEGD